MDKCRRTYNSFIASFVIVALMCNNVFSTPMLYKRNPDDKYERDLVPVSSTVIPLTALEVSYGIGGKPSEEYKEAYLKKLRKKVQLVKSRSYTNENPDTLITIKRKVNDVNDKAKMKNIVTAPGPAVDESKN